MDRPREIGDRGATGQAYLEGRLAQARLSGEFRPSRREDVREIDSLEASERRRATLRGLEALRRGEIGRAHV